jgi:hypothetical protein
MSEAYEDEIAAEDAIFARIAAVEPNAEEQNPAQSKPRSSGGRPRKADPIKLVAWRQAHKATVADTAKRWNVSRRTVQKFCRDFGEAAKAERKRFELERLDAELEAHERAYEMMFLRLRNMHLGAAGGPWREATEAELEAADQEFREDWKRRMGPLPDRFARR